MQFYFVSAATRFDCVSCHH